VTLAGLYVRRGCISTFVSIFSTLKLLHLCFREFESDMVCPKGWKAVGHGTSLARYSGVFNLRGPPKLLINEVGLFRSTNWLRRTLGTIGEEFGIGQALILRKCIDYLE
jgi:hypothetical protein